MRYQKQGLAWMLSREATGTNPAGGMLCDEQGLGKTITAIALIASNPCQVCRHWVLQSCHRCLIATHRGPIGSILLFCRRLVESLGRNLRQSLSQSTMQRTTELLPACSKNLRQGGCFLSGPPLS